jgi:uncharacterized membrane protein YqjE
MPETEPRTSGFFASLRRLSDNALSTVQNRIELLAVELQQEKAWLIATLMWAAATIFFGGLAILAVVATIIYFAPEPARPWVLLGFAVIFIWIGINAITGLRRCLREKPPPLGDSINELKKDIAWIRSRD